MNPNSVPTRILSIQNDQGKRLRRQEAKGLGPTIGEVYGMFLGTPNLRAFWPFSSIDNGSNVLDLSGQGRTLSPVSISYTASFLVFNGLVPYVELDGSADYFTRTDEAGLEFTGAMTLFGWTWPDTSTAQALVTKWGAAGNRGYQMTADANDALTAFVSGDGTAITSIASDNGAYDTGRWHFSALRFTPSTELALKLDDEWYVNTTSIPASIFNTTAAFLIGASSSGGAGTTPFDGRETLWVLAGRALSDSYLSMAYNRSRVLFGV